MIRKKTSGPAGENAQGCEQVLLLLETEASEELGLHFVDRRQPSGVAGLAVRGDRGAYRAPVVRVVRAYDQLFRLQTVDQLRDVRAHARASVGQGPERDGLAARNEGRGR